MNSSRAYTENFLVGTLTPMPYPMILSSLLILGALFNIPALLGLLNALSIAISVSKYDGEVFKKRYYSSLPWVLSPIALTPAMALTLVGYDFLPLATFIGVALTAIFFAIWLLILGLARLLRIPLPEQGINGEE